jgi:peroxiredoxin Q/BCP
MRLDIMKKAPDFSLPDQSGTMRNLKDFAGKWLVVYFYPKDDTPGCTTEACSFRDEYGAMQDQGLQVVGISKDSVKSHAKFAEKYKLNFPILADETHEVIEAYGAWGMRKFMGREYMGTGRMTFLINPEGAIGREYADVTPKEHAAEILQDFAELAK